MSDNVISLAKGSNPNEPYGGLVESLELLLSQARSGDLRALAFATVRTGNVIGTGWNAAPGMSEVLAAPVLMLGHRYAAALLNGGEDA